MNITAIAIQSLKNDPNQLTGGPNADNFLCGEGIDTVVDYIAKDGDIVANDCEIVRP